MAEEEICPHCEEIITEEDKEAYWTKQMLKTNERMKLDARKTVVKLDEVFKEE